MGCYIQKQQIAQANTLKLENTSYLIQQRKLCSIYRQMVTLQDISKSSLLQRRANQEVSHSVPTGQSIFCSTAKLPKN